MKMRLSAMWSVAICLGIMGANAQEPQRYPFSRAALLQGSSQKPYPRDTVKRDIVWMAPRIVINEPLQSFGGDIILYAEELTLNAPVDSRIYFDHSIDRFQDDVFYFSEALRKPS